MGISHIIYVTQTTAVLPHSARAIYVRNENDISGSLKDFNSKNCVVINLM